MQSVANKSEDEYSLWTLPRGLWTRALVKPKRRKALDAKRRETAKKKLAEELRPYDAPVSRHTLSRIVD